MEKYYIRISLLLSISWLLLMSACCGSKKSRHKEEPVIKEQPRPLTDHQTDSLKNYLDNERARRRKSK